MQRKTKIICTIGPASDSEEMLRKMMLAGMNVARLNFSHGTHAEHKERIDRIKKLRAELDLPVALMLDTKGPEIRTGLFKDGTATLANGAEVRISHDDVLGTADCFSISYKDAYKDLQPGSRILLVDGLLELVVTKIDGKDLLCTVKSGGQLGNNKNVNIPDVKVSLPALTDKDISDLNFAVENDLDFIAASFVRKAADVTEIRKVLAAAGNSDIKIVAKIENREGVQNFEEILAVADGVMVARGDLGVGLPAEEVPVVQKKMIRQAYKSGLPSITATQMLDSMIRNPRPTRAEVSDVANAILDGTSAIMLSGETAAGKYPLETLQMMDKIARFTEANIPYWENFRQVESAKGAGVAQAISHACCTTAMDLNAKAILCVTHSGRTARRLSQFRPACPIVAATVTEKSRYQLALSWGVTPILIDVIYDTDQLFETVMRRSKELGLVEDTDVVVMTGGTPAGMSGTTNTLKVANIGSQIAKGKPSALDSHKRLSGDALILHEDGSHRHFGERGYIVVAKDTSNEQLALIREAAALIVESEDPNCHAVTAGGILQIPVIYACKNACKLIKDGQNILLNTEDGSIC